MVFGLLRADLLGCRLKSILFQAGPHLFNHESSQSDKILDFPVSLTELRDGRGLHTLQRVRKGARERKEGWEKKGSVKFVLKLVLGISIIMKSDWVMGWGGGGSAKVRT